MNGFVFVSINSFDLVLVYLIITGNSTSLKTALNAISKNNLGLQKKSHRVVLILLMFDVKTLKNSPENTFLWMHLY